MIVADDSDCNLIERPTRASRGASHSAFRVFAFFALTVLLAPTPDAIAQRASAVTVEPVIEREISERRRVIGQLIAPVQADIAARTAGVMATVKYRVGDWVDKDQALVELDTTLIRIERDAALAAIQVAEAGIAVSETRLKQAELAFDRQEKLRNSGAFSRSRFEDLQQEVQTARAELARANAQANSAKVDLARADYQLEHAIIKAPVAGRVIKRSAQPGSYIKIGDPVATILDTSELEISAEVPANLVAGLKLGTKVPVTADDGSELSATVRAVIPVQDVSTQTRPVRFTADFAGLDPSLIATGKSLMVDVPASAARRILAVSKDALVQGTDGWVVFVVKDGKAERRSIEIGQAAGRFVEVLSGLSAQEEVVVRGNERLRPGQPVEAKSAPTAERSTRS